MDKNKLQTFNVLLEFGFKPGVNQAGFPCLILHLGAFKLFATEAVNMSFVDVITFRGTWYTGRECGEVDFELPRQMDSAAQCAAWLVYKLNESSKHLIAESHINYDWFEIGKNSELELPWKRREADYNSRPHCIIDRSWLKLALSSFSTALENVQDEHCVTISFRDRILLIRCGEQVIPSPGSGEPWSEDILIKVADFKLMHLPRRILENPVLIDVWDGYMRIGNRGYPIYKTFSVKALQQEH